MDRTSARRDRRCLSDLRWGIERETHRILRDGSLAPTSHPAALRPPRFTKDFAETQLELVTPPLGRIDAALGALEHLTRVASKVLERERLWPFSMPPRLPDLALVRIAHFGLGQEARRARLYREGLALRYGLARQVICGVHVNVSLGPSLLRELQRRAPLMAGEGCEGRASDGFHLRVARNLWDDLPLLILLFGASPVRGDDEARPQSRAVSFRNSDRGYPGSELAAYLSLESLDRYVAGIQRALRTESERFARLGLVEAGSVRQLSARVLQSEKELYAPIRLRQVPRAGESTLQALKRRGVGYLELRFLDVDPFTATGLSASALRLLHLLVLDAASRPCTPPGSNDVAAALRAAADVALWDPSELSEARRRPGPKDDALRSFARRLVAIEEWADALDGVGEAGPYHRALARAAGWLAHPETLPAAALARRFDESGTDWTTFGARVAQAHRSRPMWEAAPPSGQGVDHGLDHARV